MGNLLRQIDDVEFTDTPLHTAAVDGCVDFAMEITKLKPSFARKLNREGLSPLHLAFKRGHNKLVLRFLEVDKDLDRVGGKKGKTPLHYLSKEGTCNDLLGRFLKACPECIRDVTTKNQTALHLAVKNNRLDVLQVLVRTLRNTDYCEQVVNQEDKDGNTALHIAAANNGRHKMLKLLLRCKADKHATNEADSTALEVAEQFHNGDNIKILRSNCFIPRVSTFTYMLKTRIVNYVTKASATIFQCMDGISSEDHNALLVILNLLLTATFQASLSPPGGVWPAEKDTNKSNVGRSVMYEYNFLLFYFSAYTVFIVSYFLTLALLKKPYPHGFRTALEVLLTFLTIYFGESISLIAPSTLSGVVIYIRYQV